MGFCAILREREAVPCWPVAEEKNPWGLSHRSGSRCSRRLDDLCTLQPVQQAQSGAQEAMSRRDIAVVHGGPNRMLMSLDRVLGHSCCCSQHWQQPLTRKHTAGTTISSLHMPREIIYIELGYTFKIVLILFLLSHLFTQSPKGLFELEILGLIELEWPQTNYTQHIIPGQWFSTSGNFACLLPHSPGVIWKCLGRF